MTQNDQHGHPLSGASADARDHYERALGLFRLYSGDPLAAAEAAIADSPGFAMAHLLKAWLNLLGTEPAGLSVARAVHIRGPEEHDARGRGEDVVIPSAAPRRRNSRLPGRDPSWRWSRS